MKHFSDRLLLLQTSSRASVVNEESKGDDEALLGDFSSRLRPGVLDYYYSDREQAPRSSFQAAGERSLGGCYLEHQLQPWHSALSSKGALFWRWPERGLSCNSSQPHSFINANGSMSVPCWSYCNDWVYDWMECRTRRSPNSEGVYPTFQALLVILRYAFLKLRSQPQMEFFKRPLVSHLANAASMYQLSTMT